MADDADSAQDREEIARAEALDRVARGKSHFVGRSDCIDCGDSIPPERLEAQPDADRCVYCQTSHERQNRGKR